MRARATVRASGAGLTASDQCPKSKGGKLLRSVRCNGRRGVTVGWLNRLEFISTLQLHAVIMLVLIRWRVLSFFTTRPVTVGCIA